MFLNTKIRKIWAYTLFQTLPQKCVCGDLNIRILRCGHPFAMKWIYVFDDVKIRIWQCKDTGTMNRPLRLAVCKLGVLGVFVDILRSVSWVFLWVFVGNFVGECGYSRSVCNVFILCMLHVRRTKAWFLQCKSMVFGLQKGGFCIAKVWFLFFECYVVANRLQCISRLSVNTSRNRCRYFSAHSLRFG